MSTRGQALVEYTLIVVALTFGLLLTQQMAGPYWSVFLQNLGLYSAYNGGFDALLSVPFP